MTATEQRPADQTAAPTYVLAGRDELRTTRYSDVCGGTDELKRFVAEEAEAAASPEGRAAVRGLVDDGLYMLGRMEVRLREYQAFRDELARLVEAMRTIPEPRLADAQREADTLRAALSGSGALDGADLMRRAEEIRQVANDMEGALRRHKEAAIAAGKAYRALMREGRSTGATAEIAGANGSTTAAADATPTPEEIPDWIPAGWLPPEPHREKVVDWLKRGRVVLLDDEAAAKLPVGPQGREPWVQFEDGGVMPLRVVRWSEEVRNFYPLGADPNPRSRLYRGRHVTAPPAEEAATPT
ncbi:MAG TPA: hypothetical protein VFN74_14810 [Chloroflexota bacterium]|nr:hypothetical protein [Chloroflexota bacterium]